MLICIRGLAESAVEFYGSAGPKTLILSARTVAASLHEHLDVQFEQEGTATCELPEGMTLSV